MGNLDRRLARISATIAFADTGGNGPAVVLTHGAGMDHSMFNAQVEALVEAGYRTISWDMRGHGISQLKAGTRFTASDALDDLSALLDECRVDRAVLVGHSLGGNLAQAFAHGSGHRVVGLVVLGSTWNAGPLSRVERLTLRLAAPTLALIPARVLPTLLARASAVSPSAITRATTVFSRMPRRRFLEVWRATTSFVRPDPHYRSEVPLALMRGAEDHTGNIATAMPLWAAAEGIVDVVFPDAGHILTWDAPEATSQALLAVLDSWHADEPIRS